MKVMLITHSLRRDTAWLWTKYINTPADRAKNRLKPQCLFKTETSKIQKYSMFYVQRFIKSILLLHFPSCETCGILRGSDECMSRVTLVQYKPNSTQSSNIPVMKRVLLESHQQSLDCRTAEQQNWEEFPCVISRVSLRQFPSLMQLAFCTTCTISRW